jgi:hypothetical protein
MVSRFKVKGRRETGRFVALPHVVIKNKDYIELSYKSKALLIDLMLQYNGSNNGDLTVALAILRNRGWKRQATIGEAVKELLDANLIIRTREGQFRNPHSRCALYAVTWQPINDCNGKDLSVNPTTTAPRKFSFERS